MGAGRGGGGSPYRGAYLWKGEGAKHCFSLISYGFRRGNALYSASLSFRMSFFLLTPFDTWDCHYFGLNFSHVLLIKVLFFEKKHETLFFSLLKIKK